MKEWNQMESSPCLNRCVVVIYSNNDRFIPQQVTRNTCTRHSSLLNFCSQKSFKRRESPTVRTVYTKDGLERCASLLICCNRTRPNFHSSMSLLTEIFVNQEETIIWIMQTQRLNYLRGTITLIMSAEPKAWFFTHTQRSGCCIRIAFCLLCVHSSLCASQHCCKRHHLRPIFMKFHRNYHWLVPTRVIIINNLFRSTHNSCCYGNQMERFSTFFFPDNLIWMFGQYQYCIYV